MKFLKNKKIFKENDFFLLLPNLMEIVSWKQEFKINFEDLSFARTAKFMNANEYDQIINKRIKKSKR